jgi:DNA-binding transcriptional MerR regulator
MCAMPIGDLARRTDTSVATIRYYEGLGLMPVAARSPAGRRLYGDEDIRRLEFIRARRAFGFALKDIARALMPASDCVPNLALARDQLLRIERQIGRLHAVAATLRDEIAACECDCIENGPQVGCLIVPA